LPDGDDEVVPKYICKRDSEAGVIEDLAKSRFNVVAMLQDFFGRVGDASTPQATNMTSKGALVEDWLAFVCVVSAGLRNGCVGGAVGVGTVGTIDAYPALAFSNSPLEES
jgi:hypothetical protein